jgi:transcriptional regulator with XRE-family HTH domain
MANQNIYKMKQPALGKKILEWRTAKGLTQEELVEKCSINVRTIQRIEAGEVTPRTYTLKAILEALQVDLEAFSEEDKAGYPPHTSPILGKALKTSFFLGIVYYVVAFIEAIIDFQILEDGTVSGIWYALVKVVIMATFSIFMYGFYRLSKVLQNNFIMLGAILLIVGIIMSISKDLYMFFVDSSFWMELTFMQSVYLGILYILFGIGLVQYQKLFGSVALVAGCLSILAGLGFVTVIFALPAVFIMAVAEVFLLIILYRAGERMPSDQIQRDSKEYSFSPPLAP